MVEIYNAKLDERYRDFVHRRISIQVGFKKDSDLRVYLTIIELVRY